MCLAEGRLSETASLNVECLERADGEELVARATTIKSGRRLIRLRVDVLVWTGTRETLVAIAQVNMSPVDDPKRGHR